jgi:hypothetical protein
MTSYKVAEAEWVRQQVTSEKSFARGLLKFFREQADRVADQVSEIFQDGISPSQVSLIFRPEEEHELFMPVVKRNLGNIMVAGARAELRAAELASKAFDPSEDIVWQHLPAETRQRILAALDESIEQDYWLAIQEGVAADLQDIIKDGWSQGFDAYKISMNIREHLGGYEARRRAYRIARTETTGAMNAGHVTQMQTLGTIVEGKKWLAIDDRDLRETHARANGQIVQMNANFVIGGFEAPYPGHFSLPAAERVNCRCVVLSVLNEGILAAAENPAFDV